MDDLDRMFRRLVQNIRTGYPDYLSRPFEVSELYQNIIPYRHNRSELGMEQNQDYEFALMRLLAGERGYLVVDEGLRGEMQRELATSNPDTSAFRAHSTSQVSLSAEAVRRLDQYLAGGARVDDARLGRTAPRAPGVQPPPPPPRPAAPPPPPLAMPSPSLAAGAPTVQMSGRGGLESHRDGYQPAPPPPPRAPDRATERVAERAPERAPETAPARAPERAAPPPPPPAPRVDPPAARQAPQAAAAAAAASGAALHDGGECRYCGGTFPAGRAVTFCPHCGQNLTIRQCPACSSELEVGWRFCVTCGRSVES